MTPTTKPPLLVGERIAMALRPEYFHRLNILCPELKTIQPVQDTIQNLSTKVWKSLAEIAAYDLHNTLIAGCKPALQRMPDDFALPLALGKTTAEFCEISRQDQILWQILNTLPYLHHRDILEAKAGLEGKGMDFVLCQALWWYSGHTGYFPYGILARYHELASFQKFPEPDTPALPQQEARYFWWLYRLQSYIQNSGEDTHALSKRAGMDPETLQQILQGSAKASTKEIYLLSVYCLGVTPYYLADGQLLTEADAAYATHAARAAAQKYAPTERKRT